MTTLWGGRFTHGPAPELIAFTESLSFDRALAADDCAVLAAHARALARAGILSDDDAATIASALDEVAESVAAGTAGFDDEEDVHSVVERALFERLPELAPRVRAGLSRNDRVVTAFRRWLVREGRIVVRSLADLIDVLAARAREHGDTLMPGYTHLQRAQPVTLGHHLLAHAAALARDAARMLDALGRADRSALGSGALAGSTLELDADAVAHDLGAGGSLPNSLDAVSARDFAAEWLAAAAICGVHLSRLGEEIVLWTSAEFAFATLDDAHATGSSLMPQKKNPDIAELARGKAGRLIGDLTGLLVTMKGLPLAYNRDLQEDKEPVFDSVRTLRLMLPAVARAIAGMRFDVGRLGQAASASDLVATDLAEELVRRGMPFREAHEAVGRAVRRALEEDRALAEVAREDLGVALPDARASVARRGAPGPAPASIERQLQSTAAAVAAIRAGAS